MLISEHCVTFFLPLAARKKEKFDLLLERTNSKKEGGYDSPESIHCTACRFCPTDAGTRPVAREIQNRPRG
jgi:hypothetical protein